MQEKEIETSRCSRCKSTQVYLRLKTNERYCRSCSYVEKLGEKKDDTESKGEKLKCHH